MTDGEKKRFLLRTNRVTRDDVARHAQVSTAVVSYVINNGPRPVAPETRRRVEEAIATLGYFPNAIARSLRSDQSRTVGLILPRLSDPYYAEIAGQFQALCHEEGYLVVLCASEGCEAIEERSIGLLRNHQVDGVVILPAQDSPARLRPLLFANVPIVVLDRYLPNAHSITADDLDGGRIGTQHLLDLGHRRIGLIVQDVERVNGSERLLGYSQALASRHLLYDDRLIVYSSAHAENAYRAMWQLLRLPQAPTAVLVDSHIIALGAYRAIYEVGLRVPDDISLVGYGVSAFLADTFAPPLTTVQCAPYTFGQMAAEVMLRILTQQSSASASVSILPMALIQRASTTSPPKF